MTTISTVRRLRVFLIAFVLFVTSTLFGSSAALADTLRPNVDMGAPGGGGASAVATEEIAFTTNGVVTEF